MKTLRILAACVLLGGCITTSGAYKLVPRDPTTGQEIPGPTLLALGSAIYPARNAICKVHPKAVVVITDAKTGQELKGESPHVCRR